MERTYACTYNSTRGPSSIRLQAAVGIPVLDQGVFVELLSLSTHRPLAFLPLFTLETQPLQYSSEMCIAYCGTFEECKHTFYSLIKRCPDSTHAFFSENTRPHNQTCRNFHRVPYPVGKPAGTTTSRRERPGVCWICLHGRLESAKNRDREEALQDRYRWIEDMKRLLNTTSISTTSNPAAFDDDSKSPGSQTPIPAVARPAKLMKAPAPIDIFSPRRPLHGPSASDPTGALCRMSNFHDDPFIDPIRHDSVVSEEPFHLKGRGSYNNVPYPGHEGGGADLDWDADLIHGGFGRLSSDRAYDEWHGVYDWSGIKPALSNMQQHLSRKLHEASQFTSNTSDPPTPATLSKKSIQSRTPTPFSRKMMSNVTRSGPPSPSQGKSRTIQVLLTRSGPSSISPDKLRLMQSPNFHRQMPSMNSEYSFDDEREAVTFALSQFDFGFRR